VCRRTSATSVTTSQKQTERQTPCRCFKHRPALKMPTELPFEPKLENVDKMNERMLDKYAVSMFNKCSHQPLPLMMTEPIRIHLAADARLVAATTASTVPYHLWNG
jgi:hypothetical protein